MHQDWDELEDDADFWVFWAELQAFADQYSLTTRYVEEEFLLDGELIPVHLNYDIEADSFQHEDDPDLHFGSEYESGIDYD